MTARYRTTTVLAVIALLATGITAVPPAAAEPRAGGVPAGTNGAIVPGAPALPAPCPLSSSPVAAGHREDRVVGAPAANYDQTVVFTQDGLIAGTIWSVVLTNVGSIQMNSSSDQILLSPGTYNWTPGLVQGYKAGSGGQFTVETAVVFVTVTYTGTLFRTYPITFVSPSIPPTVPWSVHLRSGATTTSTTSSLTFYEENGTFGWLLPPLRELTPTPGSGLLQVSGGPVRITIYWALDPGAYEVLFNERGLNYGSNWSVTLNNSSRYAYAGPIAFIEPNGTYPFNVTSPFGFVAAPTLGNVSIHGNETVVQINFGPAVSFYAVTFLSAGLPPRASWSVTLANLTLLASGPDVGMEFFVTNGTFGYRVGPPLGYEATPPAGTITVSGRPFGPLVIGFTLAPVPAYTVTFTESGLPVGDSWSITIEAAVVHVSSNGTLALPLVNGSYDWTVGSSSGLDPTPDAGVVNVSGGSPPAIPIVFAPPPSVYAVEFIEQGLPAGTTWSVKVYGQGVWQSGLSTIQVSEPNGTVYFFSGNLSGYTETPVNGSVVVNGAPRSVVIVFHAVSTPFYELTEFWLAVGFGAAGAAAALVLYRIYRGPRQRLTRGESRRLSNEFRD